MRKYLDQHEEEAIEMLVIAAVREIQEMHDINLSFSYRQGRLSSFNYYMRNRR